jgi:hemin uptake protein HemP
MSTTPPVIEHFRPKTTKEPSEPGAQHADADPGHAARPTGPCTLESKDLLGDKSMVLIRHKGEIYRLQSTRQGKLILTK